MTENQLRQKVADTINAWVGAAKGSAKVHDAHFPLVPATVRLEAAGTVQARPHDPAQQNAQGGPCGHGQRGHHHGAGHAATVSR